MHKKKILNHLQRSGWHQSRIDHARRQLENVSDEQKSVANRWQTFVIWALFLCMIVTNIVCMVVSVPVLISFPNGFLYGFLFVLGALFGLLFAVLLNDIDHLFKGHHHIFLYIIIPVLSIAGGIAIVWLTQYMPHFIYVQRHPIVIGLVYTASFMLPLGLLRVLRWIHHGEW